MKSTKGLNGANVLTDQNYQYGKLVGEIVVSSPTTSVNFTGLDGNAHGGYVLVAEAVSGTASATTYQADINGDTTTANYTGEALTASGTTVTGAVSSSRDLTYTPASLGAISLAVAHVSLINGYPYFNISEYRSDNVVGIRGLKKSSTVTNITSIGITANVTNGIGAGSKFRLYRRM